MAFIRNTWGEALQHCSIVQIYTHAHTQLPYLVVELVIEEVFPQSVRKVEDSRDDDTKRAREREEEEVGRAAVLPWSQTHHREQAKCYSNGPFVE